MRSEDASPLEALWRLERRLAQQLRSGYCIGRADEGGEPLTGLNSVGEGVVHVSRERPWLQAAGSRERERAYPRLMTCWDARNPDACDFSSIIRVPRRPA